MPAPTNEVPVSTRAQILEEAMEIITVDRNTSYGSPENNFFTIAELWNNYITSIATHRQLNSHDVAVMMILVKVARIATSPDKRDHWVDIAGYAACGGECTDTSKPFSVR
jgi:hypothetical protein